MALGIVGLCGFFLVGGIILWIYSYKFFKKEKKNITIILAFIGLLSFIPTTFMIYRIVPFITGNNSILKYEYLNEFTSINHGFSERYVSRRRTVVGINIEINGFINGIGELLIQPHENTERIRLRLEGNIDEKINNLDWYIPECLIEFIPDNEFVDGSITIKIDMY